MHSAFVSPLTLSRTSVHTNSSLLPPRPKWRATATQPAQTNRVRRPENAPGKFYVDSSCIDCDTCRWLAPDHFHMAGPQSAVYSQPETESERLNALQALEACPTASIRTEEPDNLALQARDSFPLPVSESITSLSVPDVYVAGPTWAQTYGGASWIVIHRSETEQFAMMFDCPRYSPRLAKRIEEVTAPVGGVKYIVLSHSHEVHGHDKWATALGAERIIHEKEAIAEQGTDKCEHKLKDEQFPYKLREGITMIHVPGHSEGSIAMLHNGTKSMFMGDHMAYLPRAGKLGSTTEYCMQSWAVQISSVEKLAEEEFLHAWPAHGRHFHFKDAEERRSKMKQAAEYMRTLSHLAPFP